jgi:hypothetical protein
MGENTLMTLNLSFEPLLVKLDLASNKLTDINLAANPLLNTVLLNNNLLSQTTLDYLASLDIENLYY